MKLDSYLEIDVNGEETFFVNKEILCSYSGMLRKLFRKSLATSPTKSSKVKVIFHDLPGGAEAFEQMTKFCYNNGNIHITPNNTCLLYYVAEYMEISTEGVHPSVSLINQVLKSVQGITNWSWHEVLKALKQCQNHFPSLNSSGIPDKLLHSVVARIAASSVTSPCCSSPESSGLRFSSDAKSCMSSKNNNRQRTWWFPDVVILSTEMVSNIIKRMISEKAEHATISRFLFYCLKCKISSLDCDENNKVITTVVDLLYSLDANSVSCKGLFDILRICCSQGAISSSCRKDWNI
ncbi:hypothetical protein HPP92_017037 [Vanilla planifolia]|uniref:BTB domain-containing protein n=1 Tax=Vanilla planifolia TaxID=51239 RepID=A0A835QFW4_VANPL|nr:hypothetical protein HPP92_017037 [Vanilla planifolia]